MQRPDIFFFKIKDYRSDNIFKLVQQTGMSNYSLS